ncbi:MAG: DUF2442 domain-containing protein [Chloroflexi bacterium]|nr:DUF2442 domain-containing protein [Chloroflexota bacterium]
MAEQNRPAAVAIRENRLWVTLADGRMVVTPLDWYPFLEDATPEQQSNVQLKWNAVWWPDLDEGLSIDGMLKGVNPREETPALAEATS